MQVVYKIGRPKDHPRVCGENGDGSKMLSVSTGSPPRVRGKLRPISGNTRFTEDHPRVCGENEARREIKKATEGSPPRVRGKPTVPVAMRWWIRITPACAGKTLFCAVKKPTAEDHPRVCGENPFGIT